MPKTNYNEDGSIKPEALMKHIENRRRLHEALASDSDLPSTIREKHQHQAAELYELGLDILNYNI